MRTEVQLITIPEGGKFFETETGTDECTLVTKQKVNSITRASAPTIYFGLPYSTMVWIEA